MMIVLPAGHRLGFAGHDRDQGLAGERYVPRAFCEFNDMVDRVFDDRGIDARPVYRSDRDDWCLAMIASGFGFGFFPQISDLRMRPWWPVRWSIPNSGGGQPQPR